MRGAWGKPYGTVARVNIGQIILSIRCKDNNAPVVMEALRRARYKFPGRQKIIVSRKWGFTNVNKTEYLKLKEDKRVLQYVAAFICSGPFSDDGLVGMVLTFSTFALVVLSRPTCATSSRRRVYLYACIFDHQRHHGWFDTISSLCVSSSCDPVSSSLSLLRELASIFTTSSVSDGRRLGETGRRLISHWKMAALVWSSVSVSVSCRSAHSEGSFGVRTSCILAIVSCISRSLNIFCNVRRPSSSGDYLALSVICRCALNVRRGTAGEH